VLAPLRSCAEASDGKSTSATVVRYFVFAILLIIFK
jgi:hypothetical protein